MQNEILISDATKSNWQRLNVSEEDLNNRLSKRANKKLSPKKFIPVEYFNNNKNRTVLDKILFLSKDVSTTIFSLAINLLQAVGLISLAESNIISDNPFIAEILDDFGVNKINYELLNIKLPKERDFLGLVYQSLMSEGTKNQKGSYYTPEKIVDKYLTNIPADCKFLDPCCGTGSFILSASRNIKNPLNIYGFDIDKTACFIAKINLVIWYKDIQFRPNIFHTDFLTEENIDTDFDIIATNPPWGADNTRKYRKLFPNIPSCESFSFFIFKSANHIKSDGSLLFVLPESILNVKTHQDIRKFILDNFHINRIDHIGRMFSGVLTSVVILDLDKNTDDKYLTISHNGNTRVLNQDYYRNNINNNFSVIDIRDAKILEKIYSVKHIHLDEKSGWGIGIVTGNNSKYISSEILDGEKIYSGKNITKSGITDTNKYINYDRKNFQQVASDKLYRAKEKLVYKFISKKLVFAYDNEKRLFLNSANILIPKLRGYKVKDVMTFLNSTLFQYIYTKRFNELKILKGNLMELPFPVYDRKKYTNIDDDVIFEMFNLTCREISYIEKEVLNQR